MMPVPWAAYCKQRRYGDRSPASYTSIRSTTFAESHPALLTRNALEAISVFDRSPRSRRAGRAQKSLSNVQFYTDSLLLMGARFLRSSRCRKATGLSIQLTYRNPIRVSVALAPETCRARGAPCNYLQSCKKNRLLVSCRGPSSDLQQQRSSASPGAGGHWEKPPRKWGGKVLLRPSSSHLLPSASISFSTVSMSPKN